MTLETIVKKMKELRPIASEDVDATSINPSTLNARRGRKNQAIRELADLKIDYVRELIRSAIYIIVAGDKTAEFTQIAISEKFGLFDSDPELFFRDLATRVPARLYQKAGEGELFDVLGRHLEDKMSELGLAEYNQLIYQEKYIQPMNTVEEFTQVLKRAITEQIGSEIVGIQAANAIVDRAIEVGHSAKITPIVLPTEDEKLALSLSKDLERLTNRVFLVNVGKASKELKAVEDAINVKTVNEDSVTATLDKIKNSIKK